MADLTLPKQGQLQLKRRQSALLRITRFTITNEHGVSRTTTKVLTSANDTRLAGHQAFLVGRMRLLAGTRYSVDFEGVAEHRAGGRERVVTKTWSFTTRGTKTTTVEPAGS